ncbi:MAG: hypothetical protein QOF48_3367, partial [Verrucomicrobiota bacterium]
TDDIYLDIHFLSWSQTPPGGTGFSYQRSTPPPQNHAPNVAITSPANGTALSTPANVTITATATDPDAGGSIAGLEFFDGASSLGFFTTGPYTLNAGIYPGIHSLTAVAIDDLGLRATSAVVSLTVTSTPIANPMAARIPKGDVTVELKPIADGMISPIGMAVPDDGSGRIFVYDQAGLVWVIAATGRLPVPLLDLRTRLVNLSGSYDERGLLGLALHTNFAQKPYLYTYTSEFTAGPADFPTALPGGTTNNHQSVIAEWRLNPSTTNRVDPATRRELLRVDEPQSNHNGGAMRFGPDGLLYIAFGDGGQADDQGPGHPSPGGNGQDTNTILGAVIRIDVDGVNAANGKYGVPLDNPFVGAPGVDEIYAYGFRNPFSFHFERGTGALYLGDVGQNKIEEIDILQKGRNYGWNVKEGSFYFDPNGAGPGFVTAFPARPVPPDLVDPIAEYDHDDGTAVIGGTVYHGNQIPSLTNRYVFGDWGIFGAPSGRLFYLDGTIKELRIGLEDRPLGLYLKGWGEDAQGELYIFASRGQGPTGVGGVMLKLVPPPLLQIGITGGVATNGTNFQISWAGGSGPFAVQRKVSLNEPVFMNTSISTGTSVTLPQIGGSGFFRVLDTVRLPAVPFTATLNAANERPVNGTTGSGSAILSLDGNTLTFNVAYRGLSGIATLAHIHGSTNTTAPTGVLVDLQPYNGGAFGSSGTLSGSVVLTDAQKVAVLSGLTYLNVHTAANPGGEIRGQIAPVLMEASLLTAYETPQVNSAATGFGSFMLVGTQLTFNVRYQGLSAAAIAAHIHGPAPLGQNAPVIIDLSPFNGGAFGSSGSITGAVPLTPAQFAAVIDGQTYVNFHTPANPGGELRGQVAPQSAAVPFTAWISGLNERPTPLANSAAGLGLFSLAGDRLAFNISYSGLSGPAIAAHIHGATNAANSAAVQIDLSPYNGGAFSTRGILSGSVILTPAQRSMVLNGLAYVNFHTTAQPGGEARGQITTVLMSAGADGFAEQPNAIVTPASALGLFALVGNQLDLNITYRGFPASVIASHIHAPANTSGTAPVVLDFSPFNGGAYSTSGSLNGSASISASVLSSVIDGLGYINFHTVANSSGEIRGQIGR